jgi:hypothetical protein
MIASKSDPEIEKASVNSLCFDEYGNFLVSATDAGINFFYQR